ncbi:hypothetical protein YC2023_062332 [Brassica napus]
MVGYRWVYVPTSHPSIDWNVVVLKLRSPCAGEVAARRSCLSVYADEMENSSMCCSKLPNAYGDFKNTQSTSLERLIKKADGFAEVFPEHKYENFGFMFIALLWEFDFTPFIAILNNGAIMTISKDNVKPSPQPDSWKLIEIFSTGVMFRGYQALMTVVFFWAMIDTDIFSNMFGVRPLSQSPEQIMAALYLQVSISGQALIFVTRSRSWSYVESPGLLLLGAFFIAQLVATLIAVYANWSFARIEGADWGWAGVIWLYSLAMYIPLDLLKFLIRYVLSGKACSFINVEVDVTDFGLYKY